jgi:pimeloyl-ACP methyl ester carboxylesterase
VSPSRRPVLFRAAAVLAAAAALGFLAGRDGTPLWQATRVVAVALLAGAAGAAILRLGRPWRGLALLLVGITATAAGAGIAAAWLTKSGLGLTTAAGALSLVAGIVALGFGAADSTAAARGWWRAAGVVPLLLISAILVLSLAIAVAATNVPPTSLGGETPADRGLAFEEARFAAADGAELSGWYLPTQNGAAVVLLHGAGSTRSSVLDHAAVLARAGYGVLLFDARGHGRSEGRAMDFGWYGDADIAGAVGYLAGRPGVDPARIAAVGLSMGGEEAIGAAAADSRLRAVVAEGATGRTAADKAWLSEEHGFRGLLQEGIDHLTFWFADLLTEAGPPRSLREAVVAMAPRPLLLIAAGEVPDEPAVAERLQAAGPERVEVWVVPGAGHTGGLATAPEEWRARVLAFLDATLAAEG